MQQRKYFKSANQGENNGMYFELDTNDGKDVTVEGRKVEELKPGMVLKAFLFFLILFIGMFISVRYAKQHALGTEHLHDKFQLPPPVSQEQINRIYHKDDSHL